MNQDDTPKTVWRSQVFRNMAPPRGRPPKVAVGAALPKEPPPPNSAPVESPCTSCAHWEEEFDSPNCINCEPRSETHSNWVLRAETPAPAPKKVVARRIPAPAPTPLGGGVKHDDDKPRMDLLDSYAIEQLATVLGFGAKKYAAHNWRKGLGKSRLIAAALRHLFAHLKGEDLDPESGLSHAAHAMCCCMFLLGLSHRTDLDDRYKAD